LKINGLNKVDGILADLGISSHQINTSRRGFSFKGDKKLDMRMNNDLEFNAVDLLNTYKKDQLINMFSKYGEIRNSIQLANSIIRNRKKKKIEKRQIDFIQRSLVQLRYVFHHLKAKLHQLYNCHQGHIDTI